ncbi:MAG: hypothetical protein LBS46_06965 [Dysgonamonadaceae bacterium]|jgi:hypothetical protein|nr:hypothetical protein [Dysgonamonadaceae bacterium]
MVFVAIVIVAIVLYILGYKVPAFLFFFFFLTSGFNLIPEEITQFAFISKGSDYAFLILVGIIFIDILCVKNYIARDDFTKYLIVFGLFLCICILYNKFVIQLGWTDIIRTCRYQFFWIAYFVFRSMDHKQLERLLKYLFDITVIISVIYLLQIVLNETFLNKNTLSHVKIFGLKIPRYYNQPEMLQFFTILAIYNNPHKGILKIITRLILILALLGAFHRNLIGAFFLVICIAYAFKMTRKQKIYLLPVVGFLMLFVISVAGIKFMRLRTFEDLQYIVSGDLANIDDIDLEKLQTSSFSFRMAILIERNQYLWEHPKTLLLGAGLIHEDSPQAQQFDFKIGLLDEITGNPTQIDSGDISYSSMTFRLGYIGVALYLLILIYLAVFFYKKRNNKYGLVSFLFLIMSFVVSFFSSNLLIPTTYIVPLISYSLIKKQEGEVSNLH